jgi:hypothetical protein
VRGVWRCGGGQRDDMVFGVSCRMEYGLDEKGQKSGVEENC